MNTKTQTKLIFHNDGIIEPEAWELHGVSVKQDQDSAIGRFGTGACYMIAVLLRTSHKVSIKAGSDLYVFGLEEINFRGKEFQRVTCNGKPLSFTTHYGAGWTVDQAYREVYSNMQDEGGIVFAGEPMEEGTSVIIEGEPILDSHGRHDQIFLGDREPIAECSRFRVFHGSGTIYYRGVAVGSLENAHYSYEILGDMALTEDRTMKNHYEVLGMLGSGMTAYMKDEKFLREIMQLKEGMEADLDYDWTFSPEFEKVAKDLWANSPTSLNQKIGKILRKKHKDVGLTILEQTEDMTIMIDAAKDFLQKAGYPVEAPILIIENNDEMNIAFVTEGKIHLTERAFEKGLFHLTQCLMEESFHIKGFSDECRQFQTYLMEQLITQTKKRLRIAL